MKFELPHKFNDWLSFEEQMVKGFDDIPNKTGLYVVRKPLDMNIEFDGSTTAISAYKRQSLLYDPSVLYKKYTASDQEILYIGKADGDNNKLRQRIKQLVKYGYRLAENHRGGRAIWQIKDNKRLLISFVECDDAEKEEVILQTNYQNSYGVLPVANWKIG